MNLLVDLGNTRIKWVWSGPDEWRPAASLREGRSTETLLDEAWSGMASPSKVVVASVASADVLQALERWIADRWASHVYVVRPQAELLGVKNGYHRPETLGADRWAALIAARRLVSGAACIVDCGTALTIDALASDGRFLGGVIFPGLRVLRTSLVQATSGIAETSGNGADCIARSTEDAVAAGTQFGLAGAIERILNEHRDRLGPEMKVLLTGNDAPVVLSKLAQPVEEIPDLTLKGLAIIAEELI
ncbi:MAG: type III pantothenate kinase [Gammaproteobacteria bacterium]|jgi:type III pantothenate kinase|nr:type III pantothenate kinase [Gammaproteobacteria bacterium]